MKQKIYDILALVLIIGYAIDIVIIVIAGFTGIWLCNYLSIKIWVVYTIMLVVFMIYKIYSDNKNLKLKSRK